MFSIALRERRSISDNEHVLSRDFNMINDRRQLKKKKQKQIIQSRTESVFCIIHAKQSSAIVKQSSVLYSALKEKEHN